MIYKECTYPNADAGGEVLCIGANNGTDVMRWSNIGGSQPNNAGNNAAVIKIFDGVSGVFAYDGPPTSNYQVLCSRDNVPTIAPTSEPTSDPTQGPTSQPTTNPTIGIIREDPHISSLINMILTVIQIIRVSVTHTHYAKIHHGQCLRMDYIGHGHHHVQVDAVNYLIHCHTVGEEQQMRNSQQDIHHMMTLDKVVFVQHLYLTQYIIIVILNTKMVMSQISIMADLWKQ